MHRTALIHVVALIRSRTGVEEREHTANEQRRLVVCHSVGSGKHSTCLAVLALTVGEEYGVGCRISVSQNACFAHVDALHECCALYLGTALHDEVRCLHAASYFGGILGCGTYCGILHECCAFQDGSLADSHVADESAVDDACSACDGHRLSLECGSLLFGGSVQGGNECLALAVHRFNPSLL